VLVDAEWLKDHMPAIGAHTLIFWRLMWINWRLDEAIRRSMEHLKEKGGESVVAILRFLCGSLHLCRLRTKGSVPVSKY
jgi:hypothetical protein